MTSGAGVLLATIKDPLDDGSRGADPSGMVEDLIPMVRGIRLVSFMVHRSSSAVIVHIITARPRTVKRRPRAGKKKIRKFRSVGMNDRHRVSQ